MATVARARERLKLLAIALTAEASIVLFVVVVLIAISRFGDALLEVPRKMFLENLICGIFYGRAPTDGNLLLSSLESCKIPAIQKELADITGLQMLFESLPAIIWCVILTLWGNSCVRKRVAFLAILAELLALLWIMGVFASDGKYPAWTVCLSSIFLLLGGGNRILMATLNSILIEYVPPKTKNQWIFLSPIMESLASTVAPYIVKPLMQWNPWSPFKVALALSATDLIIAWWLPGRLITQADSEIDHRREPEVVGDGNGVLEPDPGSSERSPLLHQQQSSEGTGLVSEMTLSERFFLSQPRLRLCYAILCLKDIGFCSFQFVYQHVSRNFHWSFIDTSLLELAQGIGVSVTMLVTAATFVLLSYFEVRSPIWGKCFFISASALLEIAGFGMIYYAKSSLVLFGAMGICGLGGAGLGPTVKGIATEQVASPNDITRLFVIIVFVESTAQLVGSRPMAYFLRVGEGDEGLAFLVSVCFFVAVFLVSWLLWPCWFKQRNDETNHS